MCKKLALLTSFALILALAGVNTAFGAVTWEGRIASQNDDAEESITNAGAIDLGSSDLELPYEDAGKGNNQIIGIRFVGVAIAKGSTVTNAYVEFACDETKDGTLAVSLLIDGEKNPNPGQFTGTTNEISTKPRTTAKVVWAPVNWTTVGQKDQTANIASVIQEIINQDGWASGNALILMLRDNPASPSQGTRGADSFSDAATAPLLHIECTSKYATTPNPADGSLYADTWVNLTWSPGETAVSHDVYFSNSKDDATNGTGDAFRGNQAGTFYIAGFPGYPYPDGLVPGTTYYWRIDEVEANGTTKYKGPVWSFTVPPKKAYNPNPANGAKYIKTDATLSWTPGFGAKMHYVYFGTNLDTVTNATGGVPQALATYKPASLVKNTTYYWRVDEFDGAARHKGDVWSFSTIPDIQITDPTLIGWWKFDEGYGTTAIDFSGHSNDGTLRGNAQWVEGIMGGAVNLPGSAYVVIDGVVNDITSTNITLSAWIKTTQGSEGEVFAANTSASDYALLFGVQGGNPYRWDGGDEQYPPAINDGEWHMLTYVRNGSTGYIYVDGVERANYSTSFTLSSITRWSIGQEWDDSTPSDFYNGLVDDARFYNAALTAAQVVQLTRGDPLLAWNPSPSNGAVVDVERAKQPLTWSPGDKASQHDVYLGLDKAAVQTAGASDTTGIYRGRKATASYTPTETIDWGTGPYYWRVDESNTDGTVSTGGIWSFTVADHLIVEDFESYDAKDNQIWYTWHDGLGYGAPGVPPYFAGNGSGAAVGDENTASYTEETIVHSGVKSMPISYNNNKQGFAKYSETEKVLTAPRDWTKYGVGELSVWFRGHPASVGSFTEAPVGTFTMTASGTDIWDTADEFHFAYKMLTGAGSIVARVDSVQNTNAWSKAGVMIRETLDPGSKHAFACVTPANGVASQGRVDTDTASYSVNQTGVTAPRWVKLERDAAGRFTVSHSANGTTWVPVTGDTWTAISMGSLVYVGLALTSHDAAQTCQAKFSNVTITGSVSGQWAHQDIGIASNAAEPMYVAVSNATGQPAVVVHPDPAAATISTWTEWVIPLSAFSGKGINLANVDKLAIGLGTRGNMTTPGGSGKIYIDDIGLYRPRTAP